MFSLIIALVAIALVAVLAGASVYYGSDAFQGNKSQARYAEIVNQSEQISSAFLAFKIEGNSLDQTNCNTGDPSGCLGQLVSANYLSAIPERNELNRDWQVDPDGALFTTTEDAEACILANEAKGFFIDNEPTITGNAKGIPTSAEAEDAIALGAVCVEQ